MPARVIPCWRRRSPRSPGSGTCSLDSWSTSAELWLQDGRPPRAGELFANPRYASVLDRLVAAGEAAGTSVDVQAEAARHEWREGFVAESIDAFRPREWRHSGGEVLPGLVSGADLAAYSATWEAPAVLDWHGTQVAKTDLWGQGPALLQVLALLDELGGDALDPDTEGGVHAIAESWKLGMADREAWFGDRSPVTVEELLATDYVASRAKLVGAEADLGLRPGSPGGREPRLAEHVRRQVAGLPTGWPADVTTGEPTVRPRRDHERRHRPHRRRRPLGQHDLRDAQRWMAAELADHPRAGLLPGQPAADVLARAGAARLADARCATADHADADAGPSRR